MNDQGRAATRCDCQTALLFPEHTALVLVHSMLYMLAQMIRNLNCFLAAVGFTVTCNFLAPFYPV